MKTITAAAQARLNDPYGQESVLIVRCWWTEAAYQYSDKTVLNSGVFGRVLEITGLNQVVGSDGSSASQQVSVKLDDCRGDLLELVNHVDIHKKRVEILQWFPDTDIGDAFRLFEGYCNTPFVYSEADRTLDFTVLSLVEDMEFGFSVDKLTGADIPLTLPDVAFPVVFGSVAKVPAAQLTDPPELVLLEGFCVVNEEVYAREIADMSRQLAETEQKRSDLYFQGYKKMVEAAKYQDGDDGPFDDPDFPDSQSAYEASYNAGLAFYEQSEQAAQEANGIRVQIAVIVKDRKQKRGYALRSVQIQSENVPAGVPLVIDAGGELLNAQLAGSTLTIGEKINRVKLRAGQKYLVEVYDKVINRVYEGQDAPGERYRWVEAGTQLKVVNLPAYHAACYNSENRILGVYGYRRGVKVRLPKSLYSLEQHAFLNPETQRGATAWIVVLRQDLSTVTDEVGGTVYDSPRVWCDIVGQVGPNPADIISWAAATFANVTTDPVTLQHVRERTAATPMNFAVLSKETVLGFMKDTAYQARLAYWLVGRVMKFRYLPEEPAPDATLTPDDVQEMSLEITCDDSDSVVTKMVGLWKRAISQDTPHKLIVRQNVAKYGLKEESREFDCFNTQDMVERSVAYWLMRRSNVWKRLRVKAFASKATLDAYDAVRLTGWNGLFCDDDVTGIVEEAVYDSGDHTVSLSVWLPVRWGENKQYVWAYPRDVTAQYGLEAAEFKTGGPFDGIQDTTRLAEKIGGGFVPRGPDKEFFKMPPDDAIRINDLAGTTPMSPPFQEVPKVRFIPQAENFDEALFMKNQAKRYLRSDGTMYLGTSPLPAGEEEDAGDASEFIGVDLAASDPPRQQYRLKPAVEAKEEAVKGSQVEIGTVVGWDGDAVYTVRPVNSTKTIEATVMALRTGFRVPQGYPIVCVKKGSKYYFQPPTWSPEPE